MLFYPPFYTKDVFSPYLRSFPNKIPHLIFFYFRSVEEICSLFTIEEAKVYRLPVTYVTSLPTHSLRGQSNVSHPQTSTSEFSLSVSNL